MLTSQEFTDFLFQLLELLHNSQKEQASALLDEKCQDLGLPIASEETNWGNTIGYINDSFWQLCNLPSRYVEVEERVTAIEAELDKMHELNKAEKLSDDFTLQKEALQMERFELMEIICAPTSPDYWQMARSIFDCLEHTFQNPINWDEKKDIINKICDAYNGKEILLKS